MIKRYEIEAYDTYAGPEWRTLEVGYGNWCRYADIAPLEAKAAMFGELVEHLRAATDMRGIDWLDRRDDLLTRARAMEAGHG